MKLRPCIDIHNGKVKQIVGSSLRDCEGGSAPAENFVAAWDASRYAQIYREKGLPGGHIILLNSAADKEAYEADLAQAFGALKAWPGGMQIGGGINPDNAKSFLDAGASHVIVTSYVFHDGMLDEERLAAMERAVGKEKLVLDLSCRRAPDGSYHVVTDRWQKMTQLVLGDEVLDMLCEHCDEFLIHAADVEGKRGGVEKDLVALLGNWQKRSEFPVTYAGGVHSLQDLAQLGEASEGRMDVTVGSALDLFGGDLTLEELVKETGKY